jgi:hypothetical protein
MRKPKTSPVNHEETKQPLNEKIVNSFNHEETKGSPRKQQAKTKKATRPISCG